MSEVNETVVADDNESTADHLKSDSVEEVEMKSNKCQRPSRLFRKMPTFKICGIFEEEG